MHLHKVYVSWKMHAEEYAVKVKEAGRTTLMKDRMV